ncbi:MAG: rhomboid family intramembrane serine protease [Deltaproteobacteria bacterium]|nr:rhomboid family intramembrane serine protease [Deltaproteobacteria bacterium]
MFLPIGSNLPFFKFPVVTVCWILASLFLFSMVTTPELQQNSQIKTEAQIKEFHKTLTYQMSFIPAETQPTWKYFSYQFIHANWGHLVSNMWYLAIFGWILENALGGGLFLFLTLAFGALAVFPEFIFQADPHMPIVGASGAVAFMMGAAVSLFPKAKVKLLFSLVPLPNIPTSFFFPLRYLVYFWLIMQVSGLARNAWLEPTPVAYATHLAGFSFGLIAGALLSLRRKEKWIDVELSGKDLKEFYASLSAYQQQQFEEANQNFEKLSKKWPWMIRFQIQLFHIAISHKQKDLAEKIWKNMMPQLLMMRRAQDAELALREFLMTFGELPPLLVQERILITKLLKSRSATAEELSLRLQAS